MSEAKNSVSSHQISTDETVSIKVPVVRQLKDPPEIWELVHPVPPSTTLGGTLVSRLPSGRSMFVVLVVLLVGVGGYIAVRSGKQITGTRTAPVEKAKVDSRKADVEVDKKSTAESNAPALVVGSSGNQATAAAVSEGPKRKATQRRNNSVGAVSDVSKRSAVGEGVSSPEGSAVSLPGNQKTRSLANTTETAGASSADAVSSRKSKTSLSPQLIDSPKTDAPRTDAPRKSKVIQWP